MDIAEDVLEFIFASKVPPSRRGAVTVLDGFQSSRCKFDAVVCVPPSIARKFDTQSDRLAEVTTWVVPAYSCEFLDGQSGKDFQFAISTRGAGIEAMEWDRHPVPQLRVQLMTDWPGGMLAKRKKPGMVSLSMIAVMIEDLPNESVELCIVDLRDRKMHVRKNGDMVYYSIPGPPDVEGESRSSGTIGQLRRFGLGDDLK